MKPISLLILFLSLAYWAQSQVNPPVGPLPLNKIILPFGFKIEVYAQGVEDARALDFADDSTLFVGTGKAGRIYAVRPDRKVIVLAEGLDRPAGLDFYEGDLYVAEVTRIIRYENVLDSLGQSPQAVVINANLPQLQRLHDQRQLARPDPSGVGRRQPARILLGGRARCGRLRLEPLGPGDVVYRERSGKPERRACAR